jgi:DNA-directed RNA polymerase sigma subunit (sigma70/sigma32)
MRIFLRLMGVECSLIALGELVLTKQVENLLAPFSAFEQEIIRARYGLTDGREQEKLQTIGDDYNVTRERIRQIEARALHRIRSLAISLLQRRPDLSPQAS